MKITKISSVFKKLDNTSKNHYRPISTLSNFTKLFESILFSQLSSYMQNKFSKYLTGFWKNYNIQNSLLRMIESWKVILNNGAKIGIMIIDISKAFGSKVDSAFHPSGVDKMSTRNFWELTGKK